MHDYINGYSISIAKMKKGSREGIGNDSRLLIRGNDKKVFDIFLRMVIIVNNKLYSVKLMKRRSSCSEHPQRVGEGESPMVSWTVNGPQRER